MNYYETKTLTSTAARMFIDNMRWFANIGRVSWKTRPDGKVRVTASKYAWSMFVLSEGDEV